MAFNPMASPFAASQSAPFASPQSVPSVKHMTCFYWQQGHCRFSERACLYAHRYTGSMALAPIKVEHNRPAVAGRNAMSIHPRYQNWRRTLSVEERNVQEKIDDIIHNAESTKGAQNAAKDDVIKGSLSIIRTTIHQSMPMSMAIVQACRKIDAIKHRIWALRGQVNDYRVIEQQLNILQEIAIHNAEIVKMLVTAKEEIEKDLRRHGLDVLINHTEEVDKDESGTTLDNERA